MSWDSVSKQTINLQNRHPKLGVGSKRTVVNALKGDPESSAFVSLVQQFKYETANLMGSVYKS